MKVCKVCGSFEVVKDRRYCDSCHKERARKQAKIRYRTQGRYVYTKICKACKKEYKAWRKDQQLCGVCHKESFSLNKNGVNPYVNGKGNGYCWMHRRIAEESLQRKLKTGEHVHHLDNNPKNNEKDNLIVISRRKHASLHRFLQMYQIIIFKNFGKEKWLSIVKEISYIWLISNNIKFTPIGHVPEQVYEKSLKDFDL